MTNTKIVLVKDEISIALDIKLTLQMKDLMNTFPNRLI